MNNLNIFILFSTLIYFKIEENKSDNLKIAVGLVALYALYNLLKGSEGWTNSIYSTDPEAGRDNYLRSFGADSECAGDGQFQAAASPPGFPFDHCVDGNGMICGQLYSSPTIKAMWGTPDGNESAGDSYNSLPLDTSSSPRNSRCETVTCATHAHCQSNESRRYCKSGECAECSVNDDCEEDAVCHTASGTSVCVNREQIVQYAGDTRSGGPYDDIDDFGVKTCLKNDLYKTYLSSPSIAESLSPFDDSKKDLSKCSNPTEDQVLDPTKDTWSDDCCYSFVGTKDYPNAGFVAGIVIGIVFFVAGCAGLMRFDKDNEVLKMGSGLVLVVGLLLLFLFLGAPYLTSPVANKDNVAIDIAEGAVIGGLPGALTSAAAVEISNLAGGSDATEDSDP